MDKGFCQSTCMDEVFAKAHVWMKVFATEQHVWMKVFAREQHVWTKVFAELHNKTFQLLLVRNI